MIKGILFDVDGVLIDSEIYIAAACIEFFNRRGARVTRKDFEPFIGAGENKFIGGVAEKYGVEIEIESAKVEAYNIYNEMLIGNIPVNLGEGESAPETCEIKGIKEFIASAKKAGIKIAFATSADKIKLDMNLNALGFKLEDFDYGVWGNQITHKKPDPEIYLTAMKGLGLEAKDCLVIEDALNGVQAGKAAGCLCLGITGSFTKEQLQEVGADCVLNNYIEFGSFETQEVFNATIQSMMNKI